jgi:hypothetical protein
MTRRLSFVVAVLLLVSAVVRAQDGVPAKLGWQKSVRGYVWIGSSYYGGIANATFDERAVTQGAVNLLLQKGDTTVVLKTWYSFSVQKDGKGKRWTGSAQELDLGAEVSRLLADGWRLKVGYSHFFITEDAGSDVEMIVLAVSKEIELTEQNKLVGAFEFYQFFPTSSSGPTAGRFYLPSVAFAHSAGKWVASASVAGAFNSKGVFGFKSESAIRVTGQLLYKLPKGMTGPDFVYGGVPGSKQRPMRFTFGWSWIF